MYIGACRNLTCITGLTILEYATGVNQKPAQLEILSSPPFSLFCRKDLFSSLFSFVSEEIERYDEQIFLKTKQMLIDDDNIIVESDGIFKINPTAFSPDLAQDAELKNLINSIL